MDAAGLDSSFDSDELDEEMRDKVKGQDLDNLSDLSDLDEDFSKNIDMTYYTVMNPDEKLMTLRNRAQKLHEKHLEMMQEMKLCETLYPAAGWHNNIKMDYNSDDNVSNLSGYSSSHSL